MATRRQLPDPWLDLNCLTSARWPTPSTYRHTDKPMSMPAGPAHIQIHSTPRAGCRPRRGHLRRARRPRATPSTPSSCGCLPLLPPAVVSNCTPGVLQGGLKHGWYLPPGSRFRRPSWWVVLLVLGRSLATTLDAWVWSACTANRGIGRFRRSRWCAGTLEECLSLCGKQSLHTHRTQSAATETFDGGRQPLEEVVGVLAEVWLPLNELRLGHVGTAWSA